MSAPLALGDCDPLWHDWENLCRQGAAELTDPAEPRWRDIRGQGLTAHQYHRIVDIHVVGDWL
ncbi:hypothetical protein L0F81_00075 [Streptomyces tricolor]|uniref:Uncharacterized protein n=1 Tax=Streptomyces tricolor TaxID=68277 RepID=A0ABS9J805_9ACTN|nr:hypothetical protein [Streptomyces tricolor]MCG0061695.1 hypothetical protein [Streptomyces tricolor]